MSNDALIEKLNNFVKWNEEDEWLKEEEMQCVVDMSVNAIQKQMPKKLAKNIFDSDSKTCVCGSDIDIYDAYPYCPYCGQKLDWSDFEEVENE